jgi:hypothetical protein
MTSRRRLLLALVALPLWSLGTVWTAPAPRVLFVGNSYTYFNNLPEMVRVLAKAAGVGDIEVRMVAPGGWRLADHWEKGDARAALDGSRWDFVVLQEQSQLADPQTVDGNPRVGSPDKAFLPAAARWSSAVTSRGAKPVFYMTWARKTAPQDQAALTSAYASAASTGGGLLAPVGLAWKSVREEAQAIELFQPDGSHPSATGSYLAACTLIATLFGRNPVGLPGRLLGTPVNLETGLPEPGRDAILADIPPAQAGILQAAAWKAVQSKSR